MGARKDLWPFASFDWAAREARARDCASGPCAVRRYRAEMKQPAAARLLALLAALSWTTAFSVGCYCEDESRCHRSVLRELLEEHGARMTSEPGS